MKSFHENPTINTVLNEGLNKCFLPKIQQKATRSILTISVQYCAKDPSQNNKTGKNKLKKYREERNYNCLLYTSDAADE